MSGWRTIVWNKPKLDVGEHIADLRKDAEAGRGVLWDYHGMVKTISPAEVAEMVRLYEDATVNLHSRVRVPDRVRYFYWSPTPAPRQDVRSPRRPSRRDR